MFLMYEAGKVLYAKEKNEGTARESTRLDFSTFNRNAELASEQTSAGKGNRVRSGGTCTKREQKRKNRKSESCHQLTQWLTHASPFWNEILIYV